MHNKHRKTYEAVFRNPTPASIVWKDVEAMLLALGAEISEGKGSRVRVFLNDIRAVFHRPHPEKEMDKGAVKSLREFLKKVGASP